MLKYCCLTEKVGKLHSLLDRDAVERPNFVGTAIRWSSGSVADYKSGHPTLHQHFAQNLWHGAHTLLPLQLVI